MIAIDVLLEPDEATLQRARQVNAALRADHPPGFAFDATHLPHVTLVQRYVAERDLEAAFAAISGVAAANDVLALRLEVTGCQVRIENDTGGASWRIANTPSLQLLADTCLAALQPFAIFDGTADAFVPNEDGTPIRTQTIRYVECFTPEHSGARYAPHLTLGLGRAEFLQEMQRAPFEHFAFSPAAIAIHQLGNHGTARRRLWRSLRD